MLTFCHNLAGQPNIVFIFSDDLSFRDLSAYGQQHYKTPHIDQLLAQSTRFTQAYAGAPECAPSRGTLLTGLHVGHQPIRLNSSARGFEYLPDSSYTMAEMLQEAGYVTGVVGKWGLGYRDTEGRPLNQGFDYHFGYLTHYEAQSYFPFVLYENDEVIPLPQNKVMKIGPLYDKERKRGTTDFESYYNDQSLLVHLDMDRVTYAPDLLDEKAVQFIQNQKDKPFFLFYTTNLPHGPPIVDDLRQLRNRSDMSLISREWGAMVQRLDQSVGTILEALRQSGLYDNTIILFASDNGYSMHGPSKNPDGERVWPDDAGLSNKGPFKGGKFSVREGGMRIPFFIHLPGQGDARAIGQPVWLLDVFPTLADLANTKGPEYLDGYSLLPLMEGRPGAIPTDRIFYFYKKNEQAVRQGPWYAFRSHPEATAEIYLLEEDQNCRVNLASIYPNQRKRMEGVMDQIHQPSQWYWNPGDTDAIFEAKQKKAAAMGQVIRRYRPNEMKLMPWER